MNTQTFDRQSAAKTLHKPLRGFEYRYILYIDGIVYDKYTKSVVKTFDDKVTLIGINNKPYSYKIQKLIDMTFCDLDLTKFEKVKNHPNYVINKNGSLYNTVAKRFVSTTIKNGYMRYNVDWKRRLVHEVLADQWIPNPNNLETIDHIDCNKLNNSLSNLEWVDREENKRRAYENGLTAIVKSLVTFAKEDESFTLLGLENASKVFGIRKSTLCTMIKRYGNKDIIIPSGSMKGYKITTSKCKCQVQRLSDMEQESSDSEMVDASNEVKIQSSLLREQKEMQITVFASGSTND